MSKWQILCWSCQNTMIHKQQQCVTWSCECLCGVNKASILTERQNCNMKTNQRLHDCYVKFQLPVYLFRESVMISFLILVSRCTKKLLTLKSQGYKSFYKSWVKNLEDDGQNSYCAACTNYCQISKVTWVNLEQRSGLCCYFYIGTPPQTPCVPY